MTLEERSPKRTNQLSPNQARQVAAMQILFFILGLLFLSAGVGRIVVDRSGGALQKTVAEFLDASLFTTTTLVLGVIMALLGYYLLWGMSALGAKEPPAWHVGRNGLVAIILMLMTITGFMALEKRDWLLYAGAALIVLGGLAAYWLMHFTQVDFRLALGADRLRREDIKIFTVRNVVAVLLLSLLTVLGVVHAVLTDIIELPVADTSPDELLFITDFSDYNDEWDIYGGRNSVELITSEEGNQRLMITVDSGLIGDGIYSLLNRKFRDFDLQVTGQQIQSAENHDYRYGVLFRYRDTANYYSFEISGDGYYRLIKVEDGFVEEISTWIPTTDESDLEAFVLPTLIRPGKFNVPQNPLDITNHIRIVAEGDKFWFYVNGQHLKLCQKGDSRFSTVHPLTLACISDDTYTDYYEDDTFSQGRIGLLAGYTPGSSVTDTLRIAFDNVLIIGPTTPVIPQDSSASGE